MDRPATHRGWTGEDIRALVVESGARLGIPIEREAAETDFGRLVRGTSVAVISPRSVDEVEKIIAFANTRGLQLTARGRGLSQGGQAIAANSVTLDLNALDRVGQPDVERQSITCEGGASYRAVVSATAPRGLLPTVVPANLELSVGGVLSAAGFGASSHVHGPAIADVASLEVITGGGRRVVADEEHERRIFDAVLGGTGRCGILVGATLRLRPFLPKVRRFCLLYDTIGPWLEDQRALIASGAAQYLECFCTPSVQGFRRDGNRSKLFAQWFYALHA